MTSSERQPWMTKDGCIDLSKIPIDSVLRRTVIKDDNEFRDACSVLRAVYHAGREDAGIYLYGLFIHNHGNMARKEIIVKALTDVKTKESANILFKEDDTEDYTEDEDTV